MRFHVIPGQVDCRVTRLNRPEPRVMPWDGVFFQYGVQNVDVEWRRGAIPYKMHKRTQVIKSVRGFGFRVSKADVNPGKPYPGFMRTMSKASVGSSKSRRRCCCRCHCCCCCCCCCCCNVLWRRFIHKCWSLWRHLSHHCVISVQYSSAGEIRPNSNVDSMLESYNRYFSTFPRKSSFTLNKRQETNKQIP